jgi:peroxiredoxin
MLPSRTGEQISLADLKGQVVMVNFWATWCAPCRQEMPHLEALYQRYSPLGFTLLGVNVEEDPSGAEAWLGETPVSFPILFDTQNSVTALYDVIAMPSTVLIDREGNIRYLHHGYKPGYENEYQTQIRALIRE